MKNKFYLLAVLLLATVFANAQTAIPNGDFESWDSTIAAFVPTPTGWTTNAASLFPNLLQQSSDAQSGSSSAKVGVQKFNTTILSGTLTCRFKMTSGDPTTATAWVKPALMGTDSFFINVITSMYNGTALTLVRGGKTTIYPSNNSNVWTEVTVPLTAIGSSQPDSAYVGIGYWTAQDTNSYVLVDNIAFGGGSGTGINETATGISSNIENLYPNPANNLQNLVYTVNEAAYVTLTVYDMLGNSVTQVVNQKQNPGRYRAEINTANIAAGTYMAVLQVNGEKAMSKMLVQH